MAELNAGNICMVVPIVYLARIFRIDLLFC